MNPTPRPWALLTSATPRERRVLVASTLGWMLDGMDITLYAMVIAELVRALGMTTSQAGLLASVTLVASAFGGVLFGLIADRYGRRFALMLSILVYSIFTFACGLSRGVLDLALFRFLLGLGMGGEWATGAALVAETWRPEHRGKALGLMQSGFAIGYGLAAVITALVLPRWGWRAVFFAGILPALLTLWIRRNVEESPRWLAEKGVVETGIPESARWGPRAPNSEPRVPWVGYGRLILITLLMNTAALFAWWGLFTWIPPYLSLPVEQGGRGLEIATTSLWIIVMQAGMWLGYVSFGFAGDAFGRKKTYMVYLFLAGALVPFYATADTARSLLLLGPLVAFFGTGHFTGFGIITAELFPTSFRASAMGLTYNAGRALSATAPWLMGRLAEQQSLASTFWLAGLGYLAAALLAARLPEPRRGVLE